MATTSLGLPLIDSTFAPDAPNQMNALATAIDTLLKKPRLTGTGTVVVPSGTGPNQDLAVNFGVTFTTTPKVSIWSTGREGFTLSVVAGSTSTTGFTANGSTSGTNGISHNVPFAWAVIDSPWQNPYA
jgi:hypothetical protein